MKGRRRAWLGRGLLAVALLVPMMLWLSGCWLFNVDPVASFTVSAQAGDAPLAVNFSAILSSDEDGTIVSYEWSFGDGTSGTGQSVSHTYTVAGTFTVVLRVTDDRGAVAETQKPIYVNPGPPAGPVAVFSASPTSGSSPLTVQFNASDSNYDAGTIQSYEWDFGDGSFGAGVQPRHTYFSAGSQTFTVTLTIRANDGKTGTTTGAVSISAAGDGTSDPGAPSARFDIVNGDSIGVAPFRVEFDPEDSEADDGRVLASFVWSYGDGDSDFDVDAEIKNHVFVTDEPSETFSVTLLVLDNESESDTITKTVKVYNHQPVAGFEIADPEGGHVDGSPATFVHFIDPAFPAEERWHADDVTYGNLQQIGIPGVVSVLIRSKQIDDTDWFDLVATPAQEDLDKAEGVPSTSSTIPVPDGYDDNEYSYDPEGQTWDGAPPTWFPNQAWGIRYLYVDWGDGTAEEEFVYAALTDNLMYHEYAFDGTATSKTITVRAVDWLGAEDTFSRTVFLKLGLESVDESL